MSIKRVLVVGTTSDYIEILRRRYPDRVLFITDTGERARAGEPEPEEGTEILCDLGDEEEAYLLLEKHLKKRGMDLSGVTCYDCESLSLAAYIARLTGLDFPSQETVILCRDKFRFKKCWEEHGIPCPQAELIDNEADASSFLERIKRPVVLKPLTGSGSELVFLCSNKNELQKAFDLISSKLPGHHNLRMYASYKDGQENINPRTHYVIEEYITGVEYSCDFIIDADIQIIRIARKIPSRDKSAGTTLAYVLPANLPENVNMDDFKDRIFRAARSLGIQRAVCMLDFIVNEKDFYLLELTPRPGGDCLPPLISKSSGLDTLGLALDFAEGKEVSIPPASSWKQLVGLRLFAEQEGIIVDIRTDELARDRRVVGCYLKAGIGHEVVLPPNDYDSRILGWAIFKPDNPARIEQECLILGKRLIIRMEEDL